MTKSEYATWRRLNNQREKEMTARERNRQRVSWLRSWGKEYPWMWRSELPANYRTDYRFVPDGWRYGQLDEGEDHPVMLNGGRTCIRHRHNDAHLYNEFIRRAIRLFRVTWDGGVLDEGGREYDSDGGRTFLAILHGARDRFPNQRQTFWDYRYGRDLQLVDGREVKSARAEIEEDTHSQHTYEIYERASAINRLLTAHNKVKALESEIAQP